MATIINEKFIRFSEETGRAEVIAEIYTDTSEELPEKNGIEDRILHQGSVAYIISEKKIAVIDSNGEWHYSESE